VTLSEALGRWRPSTGVVRWALLCGMIGAIFGGFCYWVKVWNWAAGPSWPHAHYSELAKISGGLPETDEDGHPVLIAVRPRGHSPYYEFKEADDLDATKLTPAQWAKLRPADPKQISDMIQVTADPGWSSNPEVIRLRSHPPDTTVYYAILEKGSDSIPDSGYLRYFVLPTVPVGGFLLSFVLVLSLAWVWDGFKPAAPAPALPPGPSRP
jgi:hypothetical protein